MGKKKKNSLSSIKNIGASSFLKRYYGISHEDIDNMTHENMKSFFPQLQRTSFEYVQKNPELVTIGKIIMVEDVRHYQIPYLAPETVPSENLFLGCDDREKVIKKIVNLFQTAIDQNIPALFIIECSNPIQPFAFQPKDIIPNMVEGECLLPMMEATNQASGLLIRKDYSVVGYSMLNHGDNCYETVILPPLQGQAIGISKKTDAMGVFYEEGLLGITIDGTLKEIPNKDSLQKELLLLYPIPEPKEREREVTVIVNSPSSYSLNEMSVYELTQLMKVYRDSNQMAYYHIVRRELVRRTKDSKEFKVTREREKNKRFLLEGED